MGDPTQETADTADQRVFDRPPSLLNGGFGDFMDVFNCPDDALNADARRNDLEMSVDSFAKPMTAFYRNEADRKLIVAVIGSGCSDGHFHGPHGAASCIVELENRARRRQERVPWLESAVPKPDDCRLTPGLSCISSACEDNDRKRLCAASFGALVLLRRIDDDASRFIREQSNMDTPDFRTSQYHPGLTLLASLNFGLLGAIPIRRSSRLLSIAETLDRSKLGHAPRSLGYRRLPGGRDRPACYAGLSLFLTREDNTHLCQTHAKENPA
ncbi:hypothetical protein F5148DRAFT_1152731 [Russula earlei]|uniref:Uncharacterized protein n=1 Tax=Russula earlei TaxID=71964 RepID=A0ACC0TVD3_9AGAM|nr:hypothetical protein F5148DRAFT_1152731 [Russula earlei]